MGYDPGSYGGVIGALNTAEPAVRTPYSPYSRIHYISEHQHSVAECYPTLADGVVLTCGIAAPWTLGALVEVIPASTITDTFDVHYIGVESLSANAVYEIFLYCGASDDLCGHVRVTKNAVQDGTRNVAFMSPLIPANSRIRAAVASDTGAANTATISLFYHAY